MGLILGIRWVLGILALVLQSVLMVLVLLLVLVMMAAWVLVLGYLGGLFVLLAELVRLFEMEDLVGCMYRGKPDI